MEKIDLLKWLLNAFEIAACITGLLVWRKLKDTYWKIFPFYLGFIFLCEMTGKYLNYQAWYNWKVSLYNYLVIPVEMLFFYWLFYQVMRKTNLRWMPALAGIIYLVCWIIDEFMIAKQPFWWVQSFSYAIGILLMLILILAFFFQLTTGDHILHIRKNMMFWICLGLFIFYFGSLPFFGMGNYLFQKHPSVYIGYAYSTYILNDVMYSFFIIALLWGIPKYSYS